MGFPQDEAGISAYFKSASPVTLADVRGVYRVIEVETADYIIGSVPVLDYPEERTTFMSMFIGTDGSVAYYLRADPVGKMIDWQTITTRPQSRPSLRERARYSSAVSGGCAVPWGHLL